MAKRQKAVKFIQRIRRPVIELLRARAAELCADTVCRMCGQLKSIHVPVPYDGDFFRTTVFFCQRSTFRPVTHEQ